MTTKRRKSVEAYDTVRVGSKVTCLHGGFDSRSGKERKVTGVVIRVYDDGTFTGRRDSTGTKFHSNISRVVRNLKPAGN